MRVINKVVLGLAVLCGLSLTSLVNAATATVNLGTADGFAVLAGQHVTNVPTSVITGDVGLSPAAGTFYSGLTTTEVTGTIYAVDATGPAGTAGNNPALLTTAKNDLTTAYTDAANRTPTTSYGAVDNTFGGKTLTTGVYAFGHAATNNLTGTLTLDAQGDANAVFIFQASSDFVTASASSVQLINGAQACNVFWQVTSSATLGTGSTFVGNILALTSITDDGSSSVTGRLLARNGDVVLNKTTINKSTCTAPVTAAATTATTSSAATTSSTSVATTDTSSSDATSSDASATPKLPNTGMGPNNNRQWSIILTGTMALTVLYFLQKKRLLASLKS